VYVSQPYQQGAQQPYNGQAGQYGAQPQGGGMGQQPYHNQQAPQGQQYAGQQQQQYGQQQGQQQYGQQQYAQQQYGQQQYGQQVQAYGQQVQQYGQPGQYGSAGSGLMGIQMKRRSPFGVWILPAVTFGIYGIVWFYKVHAELANFDRRRGINPGMALLSLFVGFGIWPLIMYIKLGGHIRAAQQAAGLEPSCSGGMGFLIGLVGFGTLYYQMELNKVIDRYGDAQLGAQVPLAA
jgi:hypothetical protein